MSSIRRFFSAIGEGLVGLWRNKSMGVASIVSICSMLLILGGITFGVFVDVYKRQGKRLNEKALSIFIRDKNISDVTAMSVQKLNEWFNDLELTETESIIGERILKEIRERLKFLKDVGLEYLTLARSAGTLSGGESQRIRLATQIGSGLVGVVYVLDEPSIGLHQRDNEKLLNALRNLTNLGNTLIVVEHDEDTIRCADHIVDIRCV